jgi:Terminase large subunit, T4likevirus-type, N-terminal
MILLKPPQWEVFQSDARFRILVAGRRFGKTFLSLVELCRAAWAPGRLAWYIGPTYKQAKRVAWKPLKQMTRPYWASKPNETDLRIELIGGGTICLRGADNYDSLRGDGLDFLILDEYASIAREAWPEVLRPALADKKGCALFIGTPRGYNHFYDLSQAARGKPEWATFQFTTEEGGNVAREELESATHELDERTYRQEFQATFENLTAGLVYYAFDRTKNVEPLRYNPEVPLFWSLDFNVNPMCAVIGQREGDHVHILDELVLPDSNTPAACQAFSEWLARSRPHSPFAVHIHTYGDAAGNGRHTSASRTDWQTVDDFFRRYYCQFTRRVPSSNPLVKDRVNCVNAMLHNQAGHRRLLIDPRCKQLILDLERVHWKSDVHGNALPDIDKSDPMRSHVSDALGYMIACEFGMRGKAGEIPGSPR